MSLPRRCGRLISATVELNYTLDCELIPLAKIDRKPRNGGLRTARTTGFNCMVPAQTDSSLDSMQRLGSLILSRFEAAKRSRRLQRRPAGSPAPSCSLQHHPVASKSCSCRLQRRSKATSAGYCRLHQHSGASKMPQCSLHDPLVAST